MSSRLIAVAIASIVGIACTSDRAPQRDSDAARQAAQQAAHVQEVVAAGGVVDSIIPVAEALRRFRADLLPLDTLRQSSGSAAALVARLARAISTHDTTDLNAMVLDRAEFAWLFYESSAMSRPPYEAPPALLWGQIRTSSDEGAKKLLARLGGKPITVSDLACGNAETEGTNRLFARCTVQFSAKDAPVLRGNLFGTIVERDGRFKFVGLGNRI